MVTRREHSERLDDLEEGADVGGPMSNVNGRIVLSDAHVAGGVRTVDGDIEVGSGSHVEGGILVSMAGAGGSTSPPTSPAS